MPLRTAPLARALRTAQCLTAASLAFGVACSSTDTSNGGATRPGGTAGGGQSGSSTTSAGTMSTASGGTANGGTASGGANAGVGGTSSAGSGGSTAGGTAGSGPTAQRPKRTASEVLVVYNQNSPTSTAIAMDYASKRNITNLLSIQCADSAASTDQETIELADYTSAIATPIVQYLAAHAEINFIVLTKGIPIRVNGADTGCCQGDDAAHPTGKGQPSVDSYLAASDYPQIADAKKIGITGSGTVGSGYLNRYWNQTAPFTHAQFGGYIVTRLDGYTEADAKALVTRALAAEAALGGGQVLLDLDGARGLGDKETEPAPVTETVTSEWGWETWNADMLRAHDELESSGVPNVVDLTNTFQSGPANLLAYFSWGSNDANYDAQAYEGLTFAAGSISDTAVSTSGRTFLMPHDDGQSLMADLIAHGLTCGKAYVGEPLLQGIASPSIALDRYFSGYSMGESLYAASRFTSWEDIIIGDPLATPYAYAHGVAAPTLASHFDAASEGVQNEDCSEGGQDVAYIQNGSHLLFHNLDLSGKTSLKVRSASPNSGGNIEVRVDSETGTLLGTCAVPNSGGFQNWSTESCVLTGASGSHDLYLVFTGGDGDLFNLEWFALR